MATINDVSIFHNGKKIASAAKGEIAPPPAANLTVVNPTWASGITSKGQLGYLQQTCQVKATALGRPYNGNFKITGIVGNGTIKLTQQ